MYRLMYFGNPQNYVISKLNPSMIRNIFIIEIV